MKLLRRLGMQKSSAASDTLRQFSLYQCPVCLEPVRMRNDYGDKHAKHCWWCNRYKHGDNKTRLHTIWVNMRRRCNSKSDQAYKDYGGRGLTVCEDWSHEFIPFRNWAESSGYSDELTIDREDNDLGYSPENCRWVTMKEQSTNKRMYHCNKSGFTGVYKSCSRWATNVRHNGKLLCIGTYDTPELAVQARDSYIVDNNLPNKLSVLHVGNRYE